jgi:hypothetical protein
MLGMVAGHGRRIGALVLLGLLIFPCVGDAQKKQKLTKNYREWLEQDVVYIITKEERENFLKLATDDARDKFMERFWEVIPIRAHPAMNSRKNTTSGLPSLIPDSA